MRSVCLGVGLLMFLAWSSPGVAGDDDRGDGDRSWKNRREEVVVFERSDFRRQLRQLDHYLEEAILETHVGKRQRLIQSARREVEGLRLRMEERESKRPLPPPPSEVPPRAPINDRQLGELCDALKRESFGKDRLRVLGTASPAQFFEVAQVQRILGHFDMAGEKLDAVRLLKARILDTENYFKLYGAFEFSSDKDKLKTILGV